MTVGQRVADKMTAAVGSWPFIIIQTVLLALWIAFNVYLVVMAKLHPGFLKAWDPYPFILLNLVLSFQAAYTGPIVMMSQNRQADKDRLVSKHDYEVNQKAEKEIEVIIRQLAHQDHLVLDAVGRLEAMHTNVAKQEAAARTEDILKRIEENGQLLSGLVAKIEQAMRKESG